MAILKSPLISIIKVYLPSPTPEKYPLIGYLPPVSVTVIVVLENIGKYVHFSYKFGNIVSRALDIGKRE